MVNMGYDNYVRLWRTAGYREDKMLNVVDWANNSIAKRRDTITKLEMVVAQRTAAVPDRRSDVPDTEVVAW